MRNQFQDCCSGKRHHHPRRSRTYPQERRYPYTSVRQRGRRIRKHWSDEAHQHHHAVELIHTDFSDDTCRAGLTPHSAGNIRNGDRQTRVFQTKYIHTNVYILYICKFVKSHSLFVLPVRFNPCNLALGANLCYDDPLPMAARSILHSHAPTDQLAQSQPSKKVANIVGRSPSGLFGEVQPRQLQGFADGHR